MKRALVLTNEAARHPFRQTLPAPIVKAEALETALEWRPVRDFILTFIVAFVGISTFIG